MCYIQHYMFHAILQYDVLFQVSQLNNGIYSSSGKIKFEATNIYEVQSTS